MCVSVLCVFFLSIFSYVYNVFLYRSNIHVYIYENVYICASNIKWVNFYDETCIVYFPIHKIVQENILNIRFEIGIFRIKKRQSNPISNRQHKNDSEFFFYFYLSAFHIYKNVVCQSCLS